MMKITRFRAAGIHLGISAFIVLTVFGIMLAVWYPSPYFQAAGALGLITILASVDITVGPLLTLILFVPGKRGLLFDLCLIACLQIGALSYGMWVVMAARPAYVVLAVDRFEVVPANQISFEDAKPPYDRAGFGGPVLVAAVPPKGQEGMKVSMGAVKTGIDIHNLARYYAPYDSQKKEGIAHGIAIPKVLAKHPEARAEIDALLTSHHLKPEETLILPVMARQGVGSMFIRQADGEPLDALWIDPW
jgi:hypothetical protein